MPRECGYLLPHDPVDDFLQGLLGLAGKHALQTQRPLPQRFSHTHVQVVVGVLGGQVLAGGACCLVTRHPGSSPTDSAPYTPRNALPVHRRLRFPPHSLRPPAPHPSVPRRHLQSRQSGSTGPRPDLQGGELGERDRE